MENSISKVLKNALIIKRQIIEEFLLEEQKKSGYSARVFFGLLDDEIQVIRGKYKSKTEKYEWFKEFDEILPILEQNDMLKFFSELDLRIEQFELVRSIVNKLFEQLTLTPRSPETILEGPSIEEMQLFISKLKSEKIKNHFNSMQLTHVIDFFQPLIESTNSAGRVWMTMENFELFIRRSFGQELQLPKPEIKLGSDGKYAVVKLFYLFYFNCMEDDIMENRKKDRFVELLSNAFETTKFNDLRNDNFKGDKSRYEWL